MSQLMFFSSLSLMGERDWEIEIWTNTEQSTGSVWCEGPPVDQCYGNGIILKELHPAYNLMYFIWDWCIFTMQTFRSNHQINNVTFFFTKLTVAGRSAVFCLSLPSVSLRCYWLLCCGVWCEKLPPGLLVMHRASNKSCALFIRLCFLQRIKTELRSRLVLVLVVRCDYFLERGGLAIFPKWQSFNREETEGQ